MPLRSQTAAIIILLVTVGVLFALVGSGKMSTRVFLPQSTLTPSPTMTPTLTPTPEPSAGDWADIGNGQLAYQADSQVPAQITYAIMDRQTYIEKLGVQPPAADAAYPLLDVLGQLRASYEEQIKSLDLPLLPDAFDGPAMEVMNGTPVYILHLKIPPVEGIFSGTERAFALIDYGDKLGMAYYNLDQSEPNAAAYNSFMAWVEANVTTALAEPAASATPAAPSSTAAPVPTEEAQPQAVTATAQP